MFRQTRLPSDITHHCLLLLQGTKQILFLNFTAWSHVTPDYVHIYGGRHIYKNFWLSSFPAWEAIIGHWYWNYEIEKRRSKSWLCNTQSTMCMLHLPCFHVKHLCRLWWEDQNFHNSHFLGVFFFNFWLGRLEKLALDKIATWTIRQQHCKIWKFWPSFIILTGFHNFDQILQFWTNLRILTRFHDF